MRIVASPQDAFAFRPLTHEDIDQLAAFVAEGFAGYRSFSPADWTPPAAAAQVDVLQRWMTDPDFWGELAAAGPNLRGHAAVIRADRSPRASDEPAVAHLGHLFVAPADWGTGLAQALLASAMHAAGRGFEAMRLFVAVGQARARRFYAREGFGAIGEPFDPGLGLPVLEYRRPLPPT